MMIRVGEITQNGNVAAIAESPSIRECLSWFSREKQWINERHLQLCRIAAPTFFEQKRAEWMIDQMGIGTGEGKIKRSISSISQ